MTIDTKGNTEPLQHLKDLIAIGNDAEILNYVKGDFANNLESYIKWCEDVSQMLMQNLEMQKKGQERQKKLEDFLEKMKKYNKEDI